MTERPPERFAPGASVLGGAAAGLSYDGCRGDAVAHEEQARRREAGRTRRPPPPQSQPQRRETPGPEAARSAGG